MRSRDGPAPRPKRQLPPNSTQLVANIQTGRAREVNLGSYELFQRSGPAPPRGTRSVQRSDHRVGESDAVANEGSGKGERSCGMISHLLFVAFVAPRSTLPIDPLFC